MPSIAAPSPTRNRARACTCGSDAALRRTVVPGARTAAMSAFSVPVTLGSSRKMSALLSLPSNLYASPTGISAPSRSSARKCVSTRRRPMTSPPGGGSVTRPNRASIGPARRIDARISLHSCGSSGLGSALPGSVTTEFGPCHWPLAPTCWSNASIVSTARIRGTLSIRQGPSASSVAARIGRAAFLLPAGWIVPVSGRPPVTRNDGGIGPPKLPGRLRLRQAFANVGPRASPARAGTRPRSRHRRYAAHTPLISSSVTRWHPRNGRAPGPARRAARPGARCPRRSHAPRAGAAHGSRHRVGRRLLRRPPRMAHAAARDASHLARRRRARPPGPGGHRRRRVGPGTRGATARRRVGRSGGCRWRGACRSRYRVDPRRRADDRRQLARPKVGPPQRAARHRVWNGRRRPGRRAVSSASPAAQHRAHAGRECGARRPVCRSRAVAERPQRNQHRGGVGRRRARGRRVQLRDGALPVRRVRVDRGGSRQPLAPRHPVRGAESAPPLGDPALCGLPHYRRRPDPAVFTLAAAGGGVPRGPPSRRSLGHGAVWTRSNGPDLALAPLRPTPRIRVPRDAPGSSGGRAGGWIRPAARGFPRGGEPRRRRVVDGAAERSGSRSGGGAHPVDSRAAARRGYVMLPTWVGVVSALSLAIIALAALVAAVAIIPAALGIRAAVKAIKHLAGPAISDVRQLITSIKIEADALVGASRDVRHRIVRAADAAEERLTDLDALAEVMQGELEETALDAAATMKDVRRGLSVWRWSKKLLKGKKRR